MEGRCDKHVFEPMERHCRTCGGEFCADCLVYSYGAKKPPYCVSCALSAAGVRSTAARPQVRSKREIKNELKAEKRAAKVAARTRHNDPAMLLDARPITRPVVELEFTINDDGTINRPNEAVAPTPAPEPEPEPEPTPTPAPTRSLFDYVEEPVG